MIPTAKPANKNDDLPDWLEDTVVASPSARPTEPSVPPPPVVENEPESLPPPSAKALVKPALLVTLIVLVVVASVNAFFLTQKKEKKFVIQERATPLETIACSGGVKSEHINSTYGCSGTCCPLGKVNDYGKVSGNINVTFGFGDTNPCMAAAGETQTYSIEIIKCTDDDVNRCKYGAYSDYEKGTRITSTCQNLVVNDSGMGQLNYNYDLPGPGCYQFDICPAGPDQSCYRKTTGEAGVAFGFRTNYGVECKDSPTPTPTNTPMPTATPIVTAVCSTLVAKKDGSSDLSGLKAGEKITFTITTSGLGVVEAAAVRLKKDGIKLIDIVDTNGADGWSVVYDIPASGAGNYEAQGFIKVGGVWK